MRVSDIMTKNPVTVSPAARADEIAHLMREKGISSVILVTNGKPVGIVTERDLVHRVLALDKDPKKLMAADICTKPVIAVSIHCPVEDAVDTMNQHKIRRIVVIDDKDHVAGIVTTDDVGYNLKSMSEELAIKYLSLTKRK
ncbi:MAG: CBS domain-containing protein [Candidatus Bathyarchaeota archaeon]|jgi:CBS domain-containing protein|nr:CBS domain-containing protein [Candidatus Bathyarchaeota archaeon]